jgi:glycosyltransferase involved in cell wall biosynthesis
MTKVPAPDLSIVVACYNAQSYLRHSVAELIAALNMTRYHEAYELIFVDDASKDETLSVIREIQHAYPRVATHLIAHAHNTGRGRAVTDGLLAARGRIAGFLDIDLETPAHYIMPAALAVERGADLVCAVRVYKFLWHAVGRQILSYGYHAIEMRVLHLPLRDTEAGFKFFNRERILPVLAECEDPGWFWDTEIMARSYFAGLRIVELPTLFIKRYDKPSTVRPLQDSLTYLRKLAHFRRAAHRLEASYRERGLVPVPVSRISPEPSRRVAD